MIDNKDGIQELKIVYGWHLQHIDDKQVIYKWHDDIFGIQIIYK